MPAKRFARDPADFVDLTSSDIACLASDRITVDDAPVGYMYRDADDGGWNFFAGDEDDDYTGVADNFGVYALSTIANYDRAILAFLGAAPGTAWFREGDTFVADPEGAPAETD